MILNSQNDSKNNQRKTKMSQRKRPNKKNENAQTEVKENGLLHEQNNADSKGIVYNVLLSSLIEQNRENIIFSFIIVSRIPFCQ